MKILFVGDYSNYNRALGERLARMGHSVTIASNGGGWMRTGRDINLARRLPGVAGGVLLWLDLRYLLGSRLSGYDVVQINNPLFVDLRPERVYEVFRMLRRRNGAVYLTAMGTDAFYVDMCVAADSPLRYNEWSVGGKPSPMAAACAGEMARWLTPVMMEHCRRIYDEVDGAVSVLYEYHMALERYMPQGKPVAYAGIPVDTDSVELSEATAQVPERVNLFLGRHASRQLEKGTDLLERAAREVQRMHPDRCRLTLVENRPYAEYLSLLRGGHVLMDQVYSYTPATNALLGLARGMTVLSGAEPEYYDFIGERNCASLVNASPDYDRLVEQVESVVCNPDWILSNRLAGREFVIRNNDSRVVARRYLDFWGD